MNYTRLTCFLIAAATVVVDATAQEIAWKRVFGTTGSDYSAEVAADMLGNVFIAGRTGAGFDGEPLGGGDAYVTKISPQGDVLWSRQFGSTERDDLHSLVADNLGNVFVAGYTLGNIEGTNAGVGDAVVAKFDAHGDRIWTRQFGTAADEQAYGISADTSGNVYVSGYTWGDLAAPAAGALDAFVTKFDSAGNLIWSRQFGTPTWDIAQDVSTDGLGNVYVTGETYGDLAGPHDGSSWEDVFLIKLDAGGNQLWSRQFGSPTHDISYDVAADPLGNVYFSGDLYDEPRDLITAYVAKYDADGNFDWVREPGTIGNAEYSLGLDTDGRGNVYVGAGSLGFAGLPDPPSFDNLISKYSTSGELLWTSIVAPRTNQIEGLAFDGRQNVYAVGLTFEEADFGDIFLVKIVDHTIPEPTTLALIAFSIFAISARHPRHLDFGAFRSAVVAPPSAA